MTARVELTTLVRAPATAVFDLELDVDAHADSLRRSGETATTRSGRRQLQLGDEVTFTARHFGLRWTLTSRVTDYERPRRFVDEQTRGPFQQMRHEHLFEEIGPNHTHMTDRMTASLAFGPAGAVASRIVLRPYLRRLLRLRARHIKHLAEAIDL
jgi:ligand-binding SRPBCC domain-containing protein